MKNLKYKYRAYAVALIILGLGLGGGFFILWLTGSYVKANNPGTAGTESSYSSLQTNILQRTPQQLTQP